MRLGPKGLLGVGRPKALVNVGGGRLQGASNPQTVLRREGDGTVTVMSLANPKLTLTRQPDGTATVAG